MLFHEGNNKFNLLNFGLKIGMFILTLEILAHIYDC